MKKKTHTHNNYYNSNNKNEKHECKTPRARERKTGNKTRMDTVGLLCRFFGYIKRFSRESKNRTKNNNDDDEK